MIFVFITLFALSVRSPTSHPVSGQHSHQFELPVSSELRLLVIDLVAAQCMKASTLSWKWTASVFTFHIAQPRHQGPKVRHLFCQHFRPLCPFSPPIPQPWALDKPHPGLSPACTTGVTVGKSQPTGQDIWNFVGKFALLNAHSPPSFKSLTTFPHFQQTLPPTPFCRKNRSWRWNLPNIPLQTYIYICTILSCSPLLVLEKSSLLLSKTSLPPTLIPSSQDTCEHRYCLPPLFPTLLN